MKPVAQMLQTARSHSRVSGPKCWAISGDMPSRPDALPGLMVFKALFNFSIIVNGTKVLSLEQMTRLISSFISKCLHAIIAGSTIILRSNPRRL